MRKTPTLTLLSVAGASVFVLFVSLSTASAATGIWVGKYTVSCNITGTEENPVSTPCTICDGLMIAANVVDLLTKTALTIAGVMIAYGGFRLITSGGSPTMISEGKKIMIGALIGLGIVLFSWVGVNTILSLLSGGAVSLTNPVTCTPPPRSYAPPLGTFSMGQRSGEPSTSGGYTYDSGIDRQRGDMSSELATLLDCMQTKLPSGAKRITSISDSNGGVSCYQNNPTWNQCSGTVRQNCCFHMPGSCHYGGLSCLGKSYAADFGNEKYSGDIGAAARACNPSAYVLPEGDHVHISVGGIAGCGCR